MDHTLGMRTNIGVVGAITCQRIYPHMARQVYVKDRDRQVPLDYKRCVKEIDLGMMKWVQASLHLKKKHQSNKQQNIH